MKRVSTRFGGAAVLAQHTLQKMPTSLTHTFRPISQHAFRAGTAAVGAKAVEALDSRETGISLTLIDIFQTRDSCQTNRKP